MVDARCDAVGSEERPFSGSFSKGGGARNGVERRAEPRSIKGGHTRGSPPSYWLSALVSSTPPPPLLLGPCSPLSARYPDSFSPRSFLRSWSGERPVGGDADGRRSRAGCVVDLRVRTRGAGEGSPAAWEAGTRRDHADGRGRGTRRPLKGGLFLLFLYACCGAVSL